MPLHRNLFLSLLLLGGCAALPPSAAPPNPLPAKPQPLHCPPVASPPPRREPACPAPVLSAAEDLLNYYRHIRELSGGDLTLELNQLNEQGHGDRTQVQKAMVLAQARDWPRALGALEPILKSADTNPLKPLAQLLANEYAEQHRLEDQADKLQQQARDLQKHIDQLQSKLEALKNVETHLPVRADGNPSHESTP